jgi:Spy/CpxP family protein refolding chaperone
MKFSTFLLPFCVAGILAAQTAVSPQTAPASRAKHAHGDMVHRLAVRLSLTPDQQNQARAIFRQSRASVKMLAPKLRDERVALKTAVRTDNEVQIDRILQQDSQLNAQARAIHAKAMAKFYQILTPDQKAKFDQLDMRRHQHAAAPAVGESR